MAYRPISLVKFKPKKKQATLRRLLDANTPAPPNLDCKPITTSDNSSEISCGKNPESEVEVHDPITGYWKPTLDLSLVLDMQYFPRNQVPVQIAKVREKFCGCCAALVSYTILLADITDYIIFYSTLLYSSLVLSNLISPTSPPLFSL